MTDLTVTVDGVDYTENLTGVKVYECLNEMSSFSASLIGLEPTDAHVLNGKTFKVYQTGSATPLFKGRITTDPECDTTYTTTIKGSGMCVKLLRKMDRYVAESRAPTGASPSMVTDLISENLAGGGGDIVAMGTNDAFGANVSYRVEYNSRLYAVSGLASVLGWEWWMSVDGGDNDLLNMAARRGSVASTFTFYTSGDNTNALIASKKTNGGIVNWIKLTGSGDGANQVVTDLSASSVKTALLAANAEPGDTTLYFDSLAGFPTGANMILKIGAEYVLVTRLGSNDYVIGARGYFVVDFADSDYNGNYSITDASQNWIVNQYVGCALKDSSGVEHTIVSNTATTITVDSPLSNTHAGFADKWYAVKIVGNIATAFGLQHFKGARMYYYGSYSDTSYYAPQTPEANSNIAVNGILDEKYSYPSFISYAALELLASKMLADSLSAPSSFEIQPDDPDTCLSVIAIGDTVTMNDDALNLSSAQYRVYARSIEYSNYQVSVVYSLNNRVMTISDNVAAVGSSANTLGTYSCGAANVYAVTGEGEASNTNPYSIRFFIPADCVSISSVKASFKLSGARVPDFTVSCAASGNSHYHTGVSRFGNFATDNTTSTHTHAVTLTFNGYAVDASPPASVDVSIGVNGGTMTSVGDLGDTSSQELTPYVTGNGTWYELRFTPVAGKLVHVVANVYIKTYVYST